MIQKNINLKLLKNSLFGLLLCFMLGCEKDQDFGPLSINVGKYSVTQYRNFPDGQKDTLQYTTYGPLYDGLYYQFVLNDTTSQSVAWIFYPSSGHNSDTNSIVQLEYFYPFNGTDESHYYKVNSYTCDGDQLHVNYTYREVFNEVSDSSSGVIIFNRIL